MSYSLKIIKDAPVAFYTLDETSGTTAADISGCGNNGTYSGGITTGLLPLIPGGSIGSLITNTKYPNRVLIHGSCPYEPLRLISFGL